MTVKAVIAGLISRSSLEKLAGEKYFERGLVYFEGGAVLQLRFAEDGISARVLGTDPCPYAVRLWAEKQELQWGCACPLGTEGAFCKHLVATGLAWLAGHVTDASPVAPEELGEIAGLLQTIDEQTLIQLLGQRAQWDASLFAELALAARASRHVDAARQLERNSPPRKRQTRKGKPDSTAD